MAKARKSSLSKFMIPALVALAVIIIAAFFLKRRCSKFVKCTTCNKVRYGPEIGRQGNDFASESMLPVGARWLAQRARCVSCENDMVIRHGLAAGQFSNPTKCLTCQDRSFKYLEESIEAVHSTNGPKTIAA